MDLSTLSRAERGEKAWKQLKSLSSAVQSFEEEFGDVLWNIESRTARSRPSKALMELKAIIDSILNSVGLVAPKKSEPKKEKAPGQGGIRER